MPPRINIPPVTRALLIALVLQSALSAAIRYRQWSAHTEVVIPYLNLIPQLSLIYPWTFVTTTLVETNLVTFAVAAVTLYNGGRYLERAWSSREFAKFLLISSLVPNFLCFAVMFVFFVFSRNEHWTLSTIGGTIPLQISFLIAFSQLVPAHTVTLFRGIVSLRVPRFPILYVGAITVLSLTPMLTSASFFLAIFGMLTSWTYLRFYKTAFPDLDSSQSASLRGDASETFAFAEFFPGPVKPFVAGLSAQVFGVLVALRLCSPFSQADVAASRGDGGAFLQRGAPSSARAEAERRRAVALKALDQRLHAATAHAASRPSGGSSHQQPPPAAVTATGPTVQSQPQPSAQAAMTSQPPVLLGETNYVPEHESSEQHGS